MADLVDVVNRSSHSLVVVRLPEGTIMVANAAAAELFGGSAAELVGRRNSSLFHGADEVHANIAISALASAAVDSYFARRRLATRNDAEAWTCVRTFEVEGEIIAVALAVPVEQPRPLDGVEREFAAATGIRWLSPPMSFGPVGSEGHPTHGDSGDTAYAVLDRLPPRQREIVAALLRGERTSGIAASLFVSVSTVRSHLAAIYRAFGVRSQTELLDLLRSQSSLSGGAGLPNN